MKSLLNHLRPNRSARRSLSLSEDPIVRLRTQFPDVPDLHLRIYQSVHGLTMTSPERVFALCSAAEYIIENQISLFLNRIDYTGRIGIKSPVVSV